MVGLISKMSSSLESIWLKVWHKLVPFKVYCLVWKKNHSRLATRDNLCGRGVLDQTSL